MSQSITDYECFFCDGTSRYGVPENLTTAKQFFCSHNKVHYSENKVHCSEIPIVLWPNWRIVSKLTTDVVTYCTEAFNQKSKYAYRKIFFYKKSTADYQVQVLIFIGRWWQSTLRQRNTGDKAEDVTQTTVRDGSINTSVTSVTLLYRIIL